MMTTPDTLLSQPIFQSLGWALIHFLWQGALVALLYASLRVILRRRTANVRYAAACATMLLLLALPIATALIIKRDLPPAATPERTVSPAASTSWKAEAQPSVDASGAQATSTAWTATTAQQHSVHTEKAEPLWKQRLASLMPWLVSIWLAGVLLLSLRVMGGWIMAQRLKSWNTKPATAAWQEMLVHLTARLRVSRPVRLCESVVAEVPTVIGWLRPVILVPVSAFIGLNAQQIEALLAHELAHIRRHDYLVNLLQTAVETLLFYHPAVWWVSRQVRTEREHCCDDLAVAACGSVLTYARALAELEQLRGQSAGMPQLAVAADGGSKGTLLRRIQRLVETPASPHQRSSAWLASLVAIATVFCICVGAQATLFKSDADKDETRLSGGFWWEQALYGSTGELVTVRAQDDESDKTFEIVMPRIKETVTVVGQIEGDEVPVVTPGTPVATPVITPVVSPMVLTPAVTPMPSMPTMIPQPSVMAITVTPSPRVGFAAMPGVPVVVRFQDDDDEDKASGSYIDALAAVGYTNLSIEQLIKMKDHGVRPMYIRELKALGYQLPSVEMAIRLVDHGVNIGFIKKLAEMGYKKLSIEELIRARDHGVRPDVIEALNAAGYSNLSMEQIIRTIDHGVGPLFIKQMGEVGFSNLSLDQLIRMRDHGVGPDYIKEIRSSGYQNLTADQFIRLRDHGVTAAFLRKAKERGFNNLSLEELIKLRDADIL